MVASAMGAVTAIVAGRAQVLTPPPRRLSLSSGCEPHLRRPTGQRRAIHHGRGAGARCRLAAAQVALAASAPAPRAPCHHPRVPRQGTPLVPTPRQHTPLVPTRRAMLRPLWQCRKGHCPKTSDRTTAPEPSHGRRADERRGRGRVALLRVLVPLLPPRPACHRPPRARGLAPPRARRARGPRPTIAHQTRQSPQSFPHHVHALRIPAASPVEVCAAAR